MAGKVPGKPTTGRPRKATPAIVMPEPTKTESALADPLASAVALVAADLPVPAPARAVRKPAATKVAAPAPVAVAPKVDAPAAVAASAPAIAAPVAPTPEPQAVAAPAPAVIEPVAPAAAAIETVAQEPAPAATEPKKDTQMDTIESTATKTETMFADMNTRAKTALEKTQNLAQEMGEFHKGNFEAAVESAKIYAKGVEAMGQEAAEFGRRSFEQMTAALKGMAQVKSPAELMKLHADYVRSSFDAAVAEGSKTTEAVIKLAGDVAQPMSSRFAVVAEKVKAAA